MTGARILPFRPDPPPPEPLPNMVPIDVLPRCRHCGHTNDVHIDGGKGECWPGFYCFCGKFESEEV